MSDSTTGQKNTTDFIYWLRTFATMAIVFCHLNEQSNVSIINYSAMFLNVGVEIFFLISGFCFGLQHEIPSIKKWYIRRAERIYVPYELFLLLLAVIWLTRGMDLRNGAWLSCIFGMQGANVGLLGADQTWFITPLLICYIITPLFSRFWNKYERRRSVRVLTIVIAAVAIPLATFAFKSDSVFTVGHQIGFYIIAYILGWDWNKIHLSRHLTLRMIFSFFVAIGLRLMGRQWFDGTLIYNRLIVGYTHYLIAFSVFFIFGYLFRKTRPATLIRRICRVSFEVYLCHNMFITGPVSLMDFTGSWAINSLLVIAISFAVAEVLHLVSKTIQQRIGYQTHS